MTRTRHNDASAKLRRGRAGAGARRNTGGATGAAARRSGSRSRPLDVGGGPWLFRSALIVVRWPSEIFPLFTTSDNLALMLSTDEVFFLATIVAAPSAPRAAARSSKAEEDGVHATQARLV